MASAVPFAILMVTSTVTSTPGNNKHDNEFSIKSSREVTNPDEFWPISSTLHGESTPSSSLAAILYDAVLTDGELGLGAVELDGTSGSYIKIENTGHLDGPDAFSWFFNILPYSSQTATILEYAGADGSGNGVKFLQDGTSLTAQIYYQNGLLLGVYSRVDSLTIGSWNFVGFSYNKVWGHIDIILNTELEFYDIGVTEELVNALGDVTIGNSLDGSSPFNGRLSCIQFYQKALYDKALNMPPSFCSLAQWTDGTLLDWTVTYVPTTTTVMTSITTSTTTTSTTTNPTTTTATSTTTTPTPTTTTTSPTTTAATTTTTTTTTTPTTTTSSTTTPTTITTTTTTTTTTPSTTTTPATTTTTTATITTTIPTTTTTTPMTTSIQTTTTTTVTTPTAATTSATTPNTTPTTTATTTIPTTTTTSTTITPLSTTTPSSTTTTISTPSTATTPPTTPTNTTTVPSTTIIASQPTTKSTVQTTTQARTPSSATTSPSTNMASTTPATVLTSTATSKPGLSTLNPRRKGTGDSFNGSLKDECYYFDLLATGRDLETSDITLEKQNTSFTDCAHLCTSNDQCVVFTTNQNGVCRLSDVVIPALMTSSEAVATRVYLMTEIDTNLYIHGQFRP